MNNDQKIMEDLLLTTKGVCDLYLHGAIESDTPNVHQTFDLSLIHIYITNNRTDYVLRQMRENGLITAQQYTAALDRSTANVLEKSPASTDMYAYPHYVEYAISDVVDTFLDLNGLENTSANRYAMENKLRTGGYSVYLCLDTEIQEIVEDTLANWSDYPRLRDPSDKVYQSRNRCV